MGRSSKDGSLSRYEKMVTIAVRYNNYLKHPKFKFSLSSTSRKRRNETLLFVKRVRQTLAKLTRDERFMLENEFFDNNQNQFWWERFYTKSTYYRKRSFAIKAFIGIFEQ